MEAFLPVPCVFQEQDFPRSIGLCDARLPDEILDVDKLSDVSVEVG